MRDVPGGRDASGASFSMSSRIEAVGEADGEAGDGGVVGGVIARGDVGLSEFMDAFG